MHFIQSCDRANAAKSDANYMPAFGFVRADGDAKAVRAALPFDDVAFNRTDLAGCSREDIDRLICEMPLSASEPSRAGEHWSGNGLFGTNTQAMRLLGFVADHATGGSGVNVVIVDHGLSRDYLSLIGHGANYCGGWVSCHSSLPYPGAFADPYAPACDWHGNMIARNVLRAAPNARIFDAPLLPKRIDNIATYTVHAELLFEAIQHMVRYSDQFSGPWVIVNAWAVADSASEHGSGSYTNNPTHRLNILVQEMSEVDEIAFVFAAGNNGQFGGDPKNGTYDTGPGNSILGVNGLPSVLTVGAVRSDGLWIGSSSQGPGPSRLRPADAAINEKPDLCAPSWFQERDYPSVSNTGTSAACGLAAGVVALKRSQNPATRPQEIFADLRAKAMQTSGQADWSARYGAGVMQI